MGGSENGAVSAAGEIVAALHGVAGGGDSGIYQWDANAMMIFSELNWHLDVVEFGAYVLILILLYSGLFLWRAN